MDTRIDGDHTVFLARELRDQYDEAVTHATGRTNRQETPAISGDWRSWYHDAAIKNAKGDHAHPYHGQPNF